MQGEGQPHIKQEQTAASEEKYGGWWQSNLGAALIAATVVGAISGHGAARVGTASQLGAQQAKIEALQNDVRRLEQGLDKRDSDLTTLRDGMGGDRLTYDRLSQRFDGLDRQSVEMREQLASLAEQVAQMIRDKAVLLPGPVSAAQAECADLMARANNPQGGMVAGYLDESGTWRTSADDARDEYLDTYHRLDCPGLLGGSER